MAKVAQVQVEDLAATLDYLDGLRVILERLHEAGNDSQPGVDLLQHLAAMDSDHGVWDPLRYQTATGQGWNYVGANLAQVRDELLKAYADAAL
jgi:hypothetical protein